MESLSSDYFLNFMMVSKMRKFGKKWISEIRQESLVISSTKAENHKMRIILAVRPFLAKKREVFCTKTQTLLANLLLIGRETN